ncbi:unnamed protein product, partial [Phaeothamnion confervicola]
PVYLQPSLGSLDLCGFRLVAAARAVENGSGATVTLLAPAMVPFGQALRAWPAPPLFASWDLMTCAGQEAAEGVSGPDGAGEAAIEVLERRPEESLDGWTSPAAPAAAAAVEAKSTPSATANGVGTQARQPAQTRQPPAAAASGSERPAPPVAPSTAAFAVRRSFSGGRAAGSREESDLEEGEVPLGIVEAETKEFAAEKAAREAVRAAEEARCHEAEAAEERRRCEEAE